MIDLGAATASGRLRRGPCAHATGRERAVLYQTLFAASGQGHVREPLFVAPIWTFRTVRDIDRESLVQ